MYTEVLFYVSMYLKKNRFHNFYCVFKLIFFSTLFSQQLYAFVLLFMRLYSSDHYFWIFSPYSTDLTTSFPGENRKKWTVPHCSCLPFLDFLCFLFPVVNRVLEEIFSFWKNSSSIHFKILMNHLQPFFSSIYLGNKSIFCYYKFLVPIIF